VTSEDRPLTNSELKNDHGGYELCCIDNDECWEMDSMDDGCWCEVTSARENTTEEDVEEFTTAWEEDYSEGVEELGWSCDDTEYWYYGPLELTNEDTGETYSGEEIDNIPDVEPKEVDETPTDNKDEPGAKWPF
jgi:hypothetical protein